MPAIAQKLGEAVVAFAQVITNGAPAIGEAVKALVLTMVDVLVSVPAIADGAMELIAGVLAALATYTPQIVDSLMGFLIGLIDGIARNMPELIQAAVNLLMSFFTGITSLASIDTDSLLKGSRYWSAERYYGCPSRLAGLIPGAMVGVLGLGVVMTELTWYWPQWAVLPRSPGWIGLSTKVASCYSLLVRAIGGFVGGIVVRTYGRVLQCDSSNMEQSWRGLWRFYTPFVMRPRDRFFASGGRQGFGRRYPNYYRSGSSGKSDFLAYRSIFLGAFAGACFIRRGHDEIFQHHFWFGRKSGQHRSYCWENTGRDGCHSAQ